MITKKQKEAIIVEYGGSKANTGSTEAQIALLTADIANLTEHLKVQKKDFSCKRSLYRLTSHRRSLLNYLKSNDINRYRTIIKKLNLRGN
jgi:small subunit ribosomal protein S15